MRTILIIIALVGLTGTAIAGPWPREKGQTFLSFGTTITSPTEAIGTDLQTSYSVYAERGLGNDLTLGFDISGPSIDRFSASTFLRLPILQNSDTHRFAFQFGVGVQRDNGAHIGLVRSGLSWGRGFDTKFGSAWATVDAQAEYLFSSKQMITKADITIGVKPTDRFKVMLQVQAGDYPGSDPYARLAPSVAWKVRPGVHLELGGQIGLINDNRIGARLGTWLEF